MRIGSLLNNGPSSPTGATAPATDSATPHPSSSTASAFSSSPSAATGAGDPQQRRLLGRATGLIKEPLVHRGNGTASLPSSTSSPVPPSSSNPHMMSNLPYLPYPQGPTVSREHTASYRSPYSEPSLTASAAATSPLEKPVLQQHPANSAWFGGKAIASGGSGGSGSTTPAVSTFPGHGSRDQQLQQHQQQYQQQYHHQQQQQQQQSLSRQQQQRALPPFTALVNMQQQPTMPPDGAISPRSTAHRPLQGGQGAGGTSGHMAYFSSTPYAPQYFQSRPRSYGQLQHQQQNQPPMPAYAPLTSHSPRSGGGPTDPLMRFADVAMERATLGGRGSLQEVLAVDLLSGRSGARGSADEGGAGQRGGRNSSINIEYGSVLFCLCTFCSAFADER